MTDMDVIGQGYHQAFARLYNRRWTSFSRLVAPKVQAVYERLGPADLPRTLLDLCCGTGQLAGDFADLGYQVTGLDLSPSMLDLARQNAGDRGRFVEGDAADFEFDEPFGLIVSTFDALNHLPDAQALQGCFASAYRASLPDGVFCFDLNTRQGLRQWSGLSVKEDDEATIIARGVYQLGMDKAWTQFTGFVRVPDGLWERFSEAVYNTVFDMADVRGWLLEAGWRAVYLVSTEDLEKAGPVSSLEPEEAEKLRRVFFVAIK